MKTKRMQHYGLSLLTAGAALYGVTSSVQAADAKKPNILIIWGDDVGMWNISAYHRGMMGGSTPSIDRIGKEGMIFMDHYGQASCTAGRAAFITGQYPIRVGLATVGLPGAEQGMSKLDPTLGNLLQPLGYATGWFGKDHCGDRDEHLPTAHGFDEFFGILYHLNAGEYPEQYDFPKDPEVAKKFAQRGVVHSWALPDGTQKVEDKGPFGQERQRTLDSEVLVESKRFIADAVKAGKPFFVWHNTTRMHYRTNLKKESDGATGYGLYADGMKEMDDNVGELLKELDDLGVADNTLVMFSTDNGAACNSWPDGGNTPFGGEKGVGGSEGGFRVPMLVKWPGHIPAGVATGEFMTHEDWLPTIMAAVGVPDLKEQLLTSYKAKQYVLVEAAKPEADKYCFPPGPIGEVHSFSAGRVAVGESHLPAGDRPSRSNRGAPTGQLCSFENHVGDYRRCPAHCVYRGSTRGGCGTNSSSHEAAAGLAQPRIISLAHSYGFSNLALPLLLHGIPLVLVASPLPDDSPRFIERNCGDVGGCACALACLA